MSDAPIDQRYHDNPALFKLVGTPPRNAKGQTVAERWHAMMGEQVELGNHTYPPAPSHGLGSAMKQLQIQSAASSMKNGIIMHEPFVQDPNILSKPRFTMSVQHEPVAKSPEVF